MSKIRKAVIPAAGYGTRFLPFTKSSPKEMLPVVDKPVIQYVVEEAIKAGIEEIIFVTSSNKRTLEDHFDYNLELEQRLKESGKLELLKQTREISDAAKYVYIRQKEARGNGHAVLMAKNLVDDEPFLVLWGDEFVQATPTRSEQLVATYEKWHSPVASVLKMSDPTDADKYGVVDGAKVDKGVYRINEVVEKPGAGNAVSNLISIGGYILTKDIFPILEHLEPKKGEIWLVDAINELSKKQAVMAKMIEGANYYDSGSKFGFIKANIDMGLEHPETKDELLAYLRKFGHA